jgi:hypothetical protein
MGLLFHFMPALSFRFRRRLCSSFQLLITYIRVAFATRKIGEHFQRFLEVFFCNRIVFTSIFDDGNAGTVTVTPLYRLGELHGGSVSIRSRSTSSFFVVDTSVEKKTEVKDVDMKGTSLEQTTPAKPLEKKHHQVLRKAQRLSKVGVIKISFFARSLS